MDVTTASIAERHPSDGGASGFIGRIGAAFRSSVIYRAAVAAWMNFLIGLVAVGTVVLAYVVPQGTFPDARGVGNRGPEAVRPLVPGLRPRVAVRPLPRATRRGAVG